MKILIVGANSIYSIENHYLKHLSKKKDILCELFSAQNYFLDYYQKNLLNKVLFRMGFQNIYSEINNLLLKKCDDFNPDLLFVFKGMEIFPSTLRQIKSEGIKTVNYNPDNPFIFSGLGSGNINVSKSIDLYDLHFTYSQTIKSEIEKKYGKETHILPFGYNSDDNFLKRLPDLEEVNKVCFLANPDKYRVNFINDLANLGLKIDVYGKNWQRVLRHENVTIYNAVYESNMLDTLRKYRVQLNYMRPHNLDSHNMRTFEIPAVGGIQVAPDTPDHRYYFDNGENIFLYNNISECFKICNNLLEMDSNEIIKIRMSANKKCLDGKYSYADRSEYVYGVLKKML